MKKLLLILAIFLLSPSIVFGATVDTLVVAGGGGGGFHVSAGGGAGGYIASSTFTVTPQTYTITIGSGGNAGTDVSDLSTSGSDSVFSANTAFGGGKGNGRNSMTANTSGGSGSGGNAGTATPVGGAGTSGQGNAGGDGENNPPSHGGGGGGGSGGVGTNGTHSVGGNGGSGTTNSISGDSVIYAGGGAGGADNNAGGTGGSGGGGNPGVAGTVNTGGGGGGGNSSASGGVGGSGIVIIRFKYDGSNGVATSSTGGVITYSDVNGLNPGISPDVDGYQIHTFTTSGTWTMVLTLEAQNLAAVESDKNALLADSIRGLNTDLLNIIGVLTNPLPSTGSGTSTITWVSSNTGVVSNDGQTINRPAFLAANVALTLTATITKGSASDTKVFALTVSKLAENQIFSVAGAATISTTTPEVAVTNSIQALTITVPSEITNGTINFDALITNGTGTLPATTIDTASADITISATTTVTSTDTSWDGVMKVPTVTTVTLPAESGQTKTLSVAVEMGFAGAKLTFDKGVRILLAGQAGKRAGYIRTGISFTEITSICTADNQTAGDALPVDGDCKIDSGSDLVIWTKHFTTFATYTQTTNQSGGSYIVKIAPIIQAAPTTECQTGDLFSTVTGQACPVTTKLTGATEEEPLEKIIATNVFALVDTDAGPSNAVTQEDVVVLEEVIDIAVVEETTSNSQLAQVANVLSGLSDKWIITQAKVVDVLSDLSNASTIILLGLSLVAIFGGNIFFRRNKKATLF